MFKIEHADIYCLGGKILEKNSKTPLLLEELGLPFQIIEPRSKLKSIFQFLKNRNKYDRCFIGDYFLPYFRLLASFLLKPSGELYYLDDGASTITATNSKHPLLLSPWRIQVQYLFPLLLSFFKGHHCRFYSIFDTKDGIKNELSAIRQRYTLNDDNPRGIYIIGTTYKGFNEPQTFFPLLENSIKKFYDPNQEMFYTPHRAAVDDEKIQSICKKNNIKYIVGNYCVEVDYIKQQYNPKVILGFGSTALFTLSKIYPKATVISITYPSSMIKGNEEIYEAVNNNLNKLGVKVLTIIE